MNAIPTGLPAPLRWWERRIGLRFRIRIEGNYCSRLCGLLIDSNRPMVGFETQRGYEIALGIGRKQRIVVNLVRC